MIRAFDLLSFLLFLLGCLLLGMFGTWTDAAPGWPGMACLWVAGIMGVFTLHWRTRGELSRGCLVLTAVFTAYILWRGLSSSVVYLARHDVVFCATAFLAWVQMAGRFSRPGARYAVLGVWGLLILGNLCLGLYQKYINAQANPLSFLGFGRDTVDAVFGGFFPNSNHLCGFMELTGMIFLSVAVFGRVQFFIRVLCGLVFAAAALCVAFSTSRGGIAFGIGTVLVFALGWMLMQLRRSSRHGGGRQGLKLMGITAALGIVSWVAWTQMEQKFGEGRVFKNLNGRAEVWSRAYEQWQEAPFLGTGARSFEYYERAMRNMNTSWITWHPTDVDALFAHNDWLQLMADYGLAGLLLGAAVLAVHLARALGRMRRESAEAEPGRLFRDERGVLLLGAFCGMAAFAIHCAAEFHMHTSGLAVTAAMVLALMANPGASSAASSSTANEPEQETARPWRAAIIIAAAVPAAIMSWKVVPWAVSDYHTWTAAGIVDQRGSTGDLTTLLTTPLPLRDAVKSDPLNYDAFIKLGRMEGAIAELTAGNSAVSQAYLKAALGRFLKAYELYPQNPYHAMYVAQTLDYMDRSAEAWEWWQRALQWGDGSRLIHHRAGDNCMKTGRYAEAYMHYQWVMHQSAGELRALLEKKSARAAKLLKEQQDKEQQDPSATPAPPTPPQ